MRSLIATNILLLIFSQIAYGESLPFMQAVEKMVNRDPRISSHRVQIDAQKTTVLSKKLNFLPTLNLSGYVAKDLSTDSESKVLSGDVGLNLFRFGYHYYDLKSEQKTLKAYQAKKNALTLTIEQEAATKLIRTIHQKTQIAILHKIIDMKKQSVDVAKARYKRGLIPKSEVTKALVDFDNAYSNLHDAQRALSTLMAAVEILLGHQNFVSDWPMLKFISSDAPNRILKKDLEISKRPDFQNFKYKIDGADYQARRNRSLMLPSFDLSIDRSMAETSSSKTWDTTATIGITIPLFNGLSNYARYKSSNSNTQQLRYALKRSVQTTEANFKASQEVFKTSVADVQKRQETLELSRELYETNFNKFKQGRISLNELNWDQDRLFRSESLWAKAIQSAHLNLVDLCQNLAIPLTNCLEI